MEVALNVFGDEHEANVQMPGRPAGNRPVPSDYGDRRLDVWEFCCDDVFVGTGLACFIPNETSGIRNDEGDVRNKDAENPLVHSAKSNQDDSDFVLQHV